MNGVSLQTGAWAEYFSAIARQRGRVLVTVTRQPRANGRTQASVVTERRLRAIRYDPDGDVLELSLGGVASRSPALRCFISTPRRIVVYHSQDGTSILIEDARGQGTVVVLRRAAPGPDDLSAGPQPIESGGDAARIAATHFVDRSDWRLTCPRRRPIARSTCRSYIRRKRRGMA
jgi:hypothetical protein